MVATLTVAAIVLGGGVVVAGWAWALAAEARDRLGDLAEQDHAAIERLKELNADTAAAVGRANDRHQRAERKLAETWSLLEAEKAGREQDGITATARYGQLVAERDALRRKLEVRGAEAGLMFEIMAEWLRSHGYKVEG
jgi:hypothetical protein